MALSDIVQVNITLETGAVTQAGFGVPLFIAAHSIFAERSQVYTSASAMLTAGFIATDSSYKAALAAFSTDPAVSQVRIGRRAEDDVDITVGDAVNGTDYIITIDGTPYTYNATVPTDDETAIATALAALVDANTDVGAVAAAAVITITPVTDVAIGIGTSVGLLTKTDATVTETWGAAYTAIQTESNDFYGVAIESRTQADQETVAAIVEADTKIFVTASAVAAMLTAPGGDTTSLAAVVTAAGYNRTFVMYHSLATGAAADTYIDMAMLSARLAVNPDIETATWALTTLAGQTADTLTATQRSNLVGDLHLGSGGKNATIYVTEGGRNITLGGKVGSGEFIDIITGRDWMEARMQEGLFRVLAINKKVPFTDAGITALSAEVRGVLERGITTGFLSRDTATYKNIGYQVVAISAAATSTADKAARTYNGISFNATVAGAIHATTITGTLSV